MTARARIGWAAAGLAIALAAGGLWYWNRVREASPAALAARLPGSDSVLAGIDFAALRQSGVLRSLGGPNVAEEPEYKAFVARTGFDYQRDLDLALAAFSPRGKFFLLRGRFDWKALQAYVEAEGGRCRDGVCKLVGSAPDRRISFFALQPGVMALAVSPDESAVENLRTRKGPPLGSLPGAPLWLTLPPAALRAGTEMPAGTRMFARAMENAESATLSLTPEGARFAARLVVHCRNERDAVEAAEQLNKTTALLRDLIARENQKPNPADLSGVLTSGAFRAEGKRVSGYWPIERSFLDNLLAGGAT